MTTDNFHGIDRLAAIPAGESPADVGVQSMS